VILLAAASAGCLALLAWSGLWKVTHRRVFAGILSEQRALPSGLVGLVSYAVPVAELALPAAGLAAYAAVVDGRGAAPLAVAHAAMAVFGAALLATTVALLHRGGHPRCGCLDADERLGWPNLVRAGAILATGAAVPPVAEPLARAVREPGGALVVVAGGVLVALVLGLGVTSLKSPGDRSRRQG
jgi:hypothetical protein